MQSSISSPVQGTKGVGEIDRRSFPALEPPWLRSRTRSPLQRRISARSCSGTSSFPRREPLPAGPVTAGGGRVGPANRNPATRNPGSITCSERWTMFSARPVCRRITPNGSFDFDRPTVSATGYGHGKRLVYLNAGYSRNGPVLGRPCDRCVPRSAYE